MNITIAESDQEILDCFPVMRELRPHIPEEQFVARVRSQGLKGYRLVCNRTDVGVVAVAGFRIGESLSWGKFLYVDDLVTLGSERSKGYGAQLLAWLQTYAEKEGCQQLHLDSGLQREGAHRFYEREGMAKVALHFTRMIG